MHKQHFVYLLTNKTNTVIYCGVTNSLARRIDEHKEGLEKSFTSRYGVTKLVYYEDFDDPNSAIDREKQIKAGSRRKKIALIESMNPEWKDLSEEIW